jgi:hypothetical protein
MGLMVASDEALSYVLRNRRREAKTFAVISFGNDVRFVPKADMAACPIDVCFTPESGHRSVGF